MHQTQQEPSVTLYRHPSNGHSAHFSAPLSGPVMACHSVTSVGKWEYVLMRDLYSSWQKATYVSDLSKHGFKCRPYLLPLGIGAVG